MKTLVVANQKGGVGKSTLAVHITHLALEQGKRVLMVDMDAQRNFTLSFASTVEKTALPAADLFKKQITSQPFYVKENLAVIHASTALMSADSLVSFGAGDEANEFMKKLLNLGEDEVDVVKRPGAHLKAFAKDFDLCVIDTPPHLGVRLLASLAAADAVVTPVSIGFFELLGFGDLMQTINVVCSRQGINPKLKPIGIVPTKTHSRRKKEEEALNAIRQKYSKMVLPVELPERSAVREAVANKVPVWVRVRGEGHRKASVEWRAACDIILGRVFQ